MRFQHSLTVTRIRGGYIGKDGTRVPETRTDLTGFAFAPGVTSENNQYRTDVHTKGELFGPFGVDFRETDRVILPDPFGGEWTVVGDPQNWLNPYTGEKAGSVTELSKGA
ncbi:hypothetical protein DFO66_103384 [Brevibacterium sanguinis]|uniref:Uncharacterized protein n=2 Tax=Brevibacterium TaxID=1696 RepID=A0A366INM5_9MICO|nr:MULTISPECIES: hypothetical protein [Brevibacterium]RBP66434.1 hypothetical protein DFO66_103384 [Brevibacterium sanguinis]RBP73086.1 hypothetical protein DFO65_103384 [Brevibacterium celere]